MGFALTAADERKLVGVNARLAAVVRRAALSYDGKFVVGEGVRSLSRQRQLLREGKTKTLNSKHLIGRAVDVYPLVGKGVAQKREQFVKLVKCAKQAAADLGVELEFGHDWGWDSPHWEMKEP